MIPLPVMIIQMFKACVYKALLTGGMHSSVTVDGTERC